MTFEKTQNISIDRELQNKEEALEEQQEKFEKELKDCKKLNNDLSDELNLTKKKNDSFSARLQQIENQYVSEVKTLKNEIRKKENDFGETKQSYENVAKAATARHDQCLEFIEIVRKEEKNLIPQIDTKIRHYFNAAFQNLTISEQKQTNVSLQETRQLLQTIVEGTKKTIDTMDRKFEQFLQLQKVKVYSKESLHIHSMLESIDTDKGSPLRNF